MAEYSEYEDELYEDELKEINEENTDTEDIDETSDEPTFSEVLEDPDLFERFTKGDYTYEVNEYGKHVYGSLELGPGVRNAYAQRTVGGEDREWDDDGGHLVGSRFNGSGELENLEAQKRDINRSAFKRLENEWAEALEDGDKVYLDVQTYHSNGSQRPDTWMGTVIHEYEDGTRDWDAFSFCNASSAEQAEWERIIEEIEEIEEEDF